MHNAHTHAKAARVQRPGPAHGAVSWRTLGRIMAPSPAVSRLCPARKLRARARWHAVSQRLGLPCRSPPPPPPPRRDTENRVTIQLLPHAVSHALPFVSQHPCAMSQGTAAQYRSLYRCPYCDTKAAPSHDTIFCILTHPWLGHVRARCRTPRAQAGRVVQVAGRIAALLRPNTHSFDCIVAWCPYYVMIQYVVS